LDTSVPKTHNSLDRVNRQIRACSRCPRLLEHCREISRRKRASFRDQQYFAKPVPNFVAARDPHRARLLIVGLAPAAHGANRTGRMFTGDRSGDLLYRVMHQTGFCNQPLATHRGDGLELIDATITAAAHCAPPGNKPTMQELTNCATWLDTTFDLLPELNVVLCLGKIAMDNMLRLYKRRGWINTLGRYPFAHGAEHNIQGAPVIQCSYHPSQQNTFTGRLTEEMLLAVFQRSRYLTQAAIDVSG